MRIKRYDISVFPSDMILRTIVFFVVCLFLCFWSGQTLPSMKFFTTPFVSQIQPASSYIWNGVVMLFAYLSISLLLYTIRGINRRRLIRNHKILQPGHILFDASEKIAKEMNVGMPVIILDHDANNSDALAFGIWRYRTISMGRRLLAMAFSNPAELDARIAHELSHFKNRDVRYAYFGRSLIETNVVIGLLSMLWCLLRPYRQFAMNYYAFDNHWVWFRLHAKFEALNWWNTALAGLYITAPAYLMWTLLLLVEYKALLRSREILADAQAAKYRQKELTAIFQENVSRRSISGLSRIAAKVWGAHPPLQERLAASLGSINPARPSIWRFVFLGFLMSQSYALLSKASMALHALYPRYAPSIDANPVATMLSLFSTQHIVTNLVFILLLFLSTLILFVAIMTAFQVMICNRLADQKWGLLLALQIAAGFTLGSAIGDTVDPYGHFRTNPAPVFSASFIYDIRGISPLPFITTFIMMAVASIMLLLVSSALYKSNKHVEMKQSSWLVMGALCYAIAYEAIICINFLYYDARRQFAWVFVFWLLFYGSILFMFVVKKGGRIKAPEGGSFPYWAQVKVNNSGIID